MEVCLGCDDLDAKTAEIWGYLNRTFDSKSKLDEFVANLADRISAWPIEAISRCKASINNADTSWKEGLVEEAFFFKKHCVQKPHKPTCAPHWIWDCKRPRVKKIWDSFVFSLAEQP